MWVGEGRFGHWAGLEDNHDGGFRQRRGLDAKMKEKEVSGRTRG